MNTQASTPPPPPGFVPANSQQNQQPDMKTQLQDNPHGEGLYRFIDTSKLPQLPDNASEEDVRRAVLSAPVIHVPYSKALELLGHPEKHVGIGEHEMDAYSQGAQQAVEKYGLALHPDEAEHIYNDSRQDPKLKDTRWQNFLSTIPALQTAIGFTKEGAKTLTGLDTIASKATGRDKSGATGTNTGKPKRTGVEQAVQNYAEHGGENPNLNEQEQNELQTGSYHGLGGMAETGAEFLGGEGLLTKLSKLTKAPVALKDAAQIEHEIQKGSTMGQILKTALTAGGVGAGQTYAKTGGDTDAALSSGATTAALVGGTGLAGKVGGKIVESLMPKASKSVEAAGDYAGHAQESIRGPIEKLNAATGEGETTIPAQTTERETGLLDAQGKPAKVTTTTPAKTVAAMPKIDVNETLNRVGDYTRARQELGDSLNTVQDQMGPEYKTARAQMAEAEKSADSGKPEDQAAYEAAQKKLDDVIQASGAAPEMKTALKSGWRNYYLLKPAQQVLDKSLEGLPGATQASYEQRGINGKTLLGGLNQMVRKNGRNATAAAFGGEDRLQALEEIGQKAYTVKGRGLLNKAIDSVARLAGAGLGYKTTGHWVGAAVGAELGGSVLRATQEQTGAVIKSMLSNPRIARAITFAVDSGADPEKYAPGIAAMVTKYFSQTQEEPKKEDNDNGEQNSDE